MKSLVFSFAFIASILCASCTNVANKENDTMKNDSIVAVDSTMSDSTLVTEVDSMATDSTIAE